MGLRMEKVGSTNRLKSIIKQGSGGSGDLTRVKADTDLYIRFLTEPDEWVRYDEHFVKGGGGYFPCTDDGSCVACADGVKRSSKILAAVADVEAEPPRAIALVVPYSVADDLAKRYDRRNTIMDRTYIISRSGSGLEDTSYSLDHEEPKPMKALKALAIPDLAEILEALIPQDDDDADDEEAERRADRRSEAKRGRKPERTSRDRDDRPRRSTRDDDDEPPRRAVKKAQRPVGRRTTTLDSMRKQPPAKVAKKVLKKSNRPPF